MPAAAGAREIRRGIVGIGESDRGLSIISDRFDGDGFGSWIGSGGIHALVPILCAVLEASLMWFGLR
jgi:hypothetical protein